jgi:hypothetical protein
VYYVKGAGMTSNENTIIKRMKEKYKRRKKHGMQKDEGKTEGEEVRYEINYLLRGTRQIAAE